MTVNGWLQLAIFVAVLATARVPFLGGYMARVYQGERILLERPLGLAGAADLPADRAPVPRPSRT